MGMEKELVQDEEQGEKGEVVQVCGSMVIRRHKPQLPSQSRHQRRFLRPVRYLYLQ